MRAKKKFDLTEGSLWSHMIRLAIPTIGGMLAFTIFNLTDTYFVGKLGTKSLAAMGFTFPVVMIVGSVASGVSIGATSVLARAVGNKNIKQMKRTATDGILLSVIAVIIVSIVGLLTMDPVFKLLGADADTLPLVKEYMTIWYACVMVVIMPPISDSAMRAVGDMVRPLVVMLVCAITNIILDPIFIFGWFGLPAMGIKGAALATVISRFLGMIATLSFLHFYHGLLDFSPTSFSNIFESWKRILHVGLPGAVVRLFPQLLRSVLTSFAATVAGTTAVAALAAGTRIESFGFIISGAVGSAIVPLVGQNWGARKYNRVKKLNDIINKIAIGLGLFMFILALLFAKPLTRVFTQDPKVVELTVLYLRIMLFGWIGLNLYNWAGQQLNAVGKPFWGLVINAVGTCAILIPATIMGSKVNGYTGMLLGLCVGQLLLGALSIFIERNQLQPQSSQLQNLQ